MRFAAALPECAARRIVIWHDAEGEFAEEFVALSEDSGAAGAEVEADSADLGFIAHLGGVEVRCMEVEDGNTFAVQHLLYRQAPTSNFLLYRRRARGQIDGDWLADVELYAEHFQADHASMLLDELGAADTTGVRQALARTKQFFAAKDRRQGFARLMAHAASPEDVCRGVLAVTLGAQDASNEAVVRAYVSAVFAHSQEQAGSGEGGDEPAELRRLCSYGAEEALADLLKRSLGFGGDLADGLALAKQLLVTALAATMPVQGLQGLERWCAPGNATFARSIVRAWAAAGPAEAQTLHDMCRCVEQDLRLAQRFGKLPLEQLMESDVFPAIGEAIAAQLMQSVADGADRREEAERALRVRREMEWYDEVRPYYECLQAAMFMQGFYRDHAEGFHVARARDAWDAYVGDWWRMDSHYRSFELWFAECVNAGNDALDDAVRQLATWADSLYANWYLASSNACWTSAAANEWAACGSIEGVPRQHDFYNNEVERALGHSKRVVVGISDAMRYEVGQALAEELRRKMRGTAEVAAMQAVFPSETRFGMAALLPHAKLAFDAAGDEVFGDGASTEGTPAREKILQARRPASAAIQYTDLIAMPRAERKAFAAPLQVLYVYHNKIDAAGHGETSGQAVFDACGDAIDDMATLARMAVNDLGASRVLFTADHGFLYTASGVPEADLASRGEVEGELLKVERRYVRAELGASSESFLCMNMEKLDGGESSWWAPRDCVRIMAGGSKSFVHGGVSLQELCVPVVRFRDVRAGAKDFEEQQYATLALLTEQRRITSSIFNIDLFQPERVGGKVLPCEYELVFCDEAGNDVTDVRPAHATSTDADDRQRRAHVKFTLRPGRAWKSGEPCYLTVRNKETGELVWTQQFNVEMAFAPLDDFGF